MRPLTHETEKAMSFVGNVDTDNSDMVKELVAATSAQPNVANAASSATAVSSQEEIWRKAQEEEAEKAKAERKAAAKQRQEEQTLKRKSDAQLRAKAWLSGIGKEIQRAVDTLNELETSDAADPEIKNLYKGKITSHKESLNGLRTLFENDAPNVEQCQKADGAG